LICLLACLVCLLACSSISLLLARPSACLLACLPARLVVCPACVSGFLPICSSGSVFVYVFTFGLLVLEFLMEQLGR
jgi:hypothetical protein